MYFDADKPRVQRLNEFSRNNPEAAREAANTAHSNINIIHANRIILDNIVLSAHNQDLLREDIERRQRAAKYSIENLLTDRIGNILLLKTTREIVDAVKVSGIDEVTARLAAQPLGPEDYGGGD